ncbi:MAG: hypothetical protein KDA88_14765 [Planctomycetaceae bacterium]|nr:hypothetical protein [Planctomycetaceae bacterium]MCB9950922.1 hypothetical protein [Planctomycetaceae bacterium]
MNETKNDDIREQAAAAWKRFGLIYVVLVVLSLFARQTATSYVSPEAAVFLGPIPMTFELPLQGIPLTLVLLSGISMFLASPNALTGVAFVFSLGTWFGIGMWISRLLAV